MPLRVWRSRSSGAWVAAVADEIATKSGKGPSGPFFLSRVSQPVRLSLAQPLVGQVSNGDIARANFAGDYAPKLGRQR